MHTGSHGWTLHAAQMPWLIAVSKAHDMPYIRRALEVKMKVMNYVTVNTKNLRGKIKCLRIPNRSLIFLTYKECSHIGMQTGCACQQKA